MTGTRAGLEHNLRAKPQCALVAASGTPVPPVCLKLQSSKVKSESGTSNMGFGSPLDFPRQPRAIPPKKRPEQIGQVWLQLPPTRGQVAGFFYPAASLQFLVGQNPWKGPPDFGRAFPFGIMLKGTLKGKKRDSEFPS